MVTAVYSLSRVHGAEIWLMFWFVCVAVYIACGLMFKHNRTRKGIITVLTGLVIAELITDIFWAVVYYENGVYVNYGIVAALGMLIWVPVLAITLLAVTVKNGNN